MEPGADAATPEIDSEETEGPDGLTVRQRAFVGAYAICLNGRKAAVEAGYAPQNARFQAARLKAMPKIGQAIDVALAGRGTGKNEMLSRLDFITDSMGAIEEAVTTETIKKKVGRGSTAKEIETKVTRLDLETATQNGVLQCAKKVKVDRFGCLTIELYDAMDAMRDTARLKGYIDRTTSSASIGANADGEEDDDDEMTSDEIARVLTAPL